MVWKSVEFDEGPFTEASSKLHPAPQGVLHSTRIVTAKVKGQKISKKRRDCEDDLSAPPIEVQAVHVGNRKIANPTFDRRRSRKIGINKASELDLILENTLIEIRKNS